MSNRLKDWKLKINEFMDTPYSIQIVLITVISVAILITVIIDRVSTTPDEEAKQMIQKATYEGHEYLIYQHRGICHSPNCSCYNKGSKE